MEPHHVGRKIGIGARLAGGMIRDRASQTAETVRQDAPVYIEQGTGRAKSAKQGAKKFGQSIWGPFVHAGSVLWLEVTGLFFALFSLFFIQGAYRLRADWRSGPNHGRMLMYAAIALVFLYFAVSSFYRARRKQLKRDAQLQNK